MKFTPIILSTISLVVALFAFYESARSNNKKVNIPISTESKQNLVVVDFQDIYNAYRAQSGAETQLNEAISKANQALNVKREELKGIVTKIQANQEELKKVDLSAERLNAIKEQVTGQLQEAQKLNEFLTGQAQIVQENVNKESLRINQGLYADLQRIIKRKAQAQGYKYVINSQAQDLTQTPIFLYSQETTDLTGEIMKEMNLNPVSSDNSKASPMIPKEKKEDPKSDNAPVKEETAE